MHADKIYKFLEGTDLTNINHTKVAHDGLYAIDQNVNIQTEAHARHINEDINETSSLITLDNRDEADNLNIKGDVFIKYFNLNKSSGVLVLIILLLCFIMFQIFIIGADLIVMKWYTFNYLKIGVNLFNFYIKGLIMKIHLIKLLFH